MKIHPMWTVCIITRLCLAYIVFRFGPIHKRILSLILMTMGLGFVYKGYFGSNNETQIAPVFWHDTRYIHGTLYSLSALYLINGNPTISAILLLTDILFSIVYRIITNQ